METVESPRLWSRIGAIRRPLRLLQRRLVLVRQSRVAVVANPPHPAADAVLSA